MKASSLSLSLQFSLFLFWQMNLTLCCSAEHETGYVCLIFCPLIYCCLNRSIVFSWKFQLLMGSLSQRPLIILDQRHQRGRWLLEKGCKQDCKNGLHAVCACPRWMLRGILHKGHWLQLQHTSWVQHSYRTRLPGSVDAVLCIFEQLKTWLLSAGKPCCWQQLPWWILLTLVWFGNSDSNVRTIPKEFIRQ